jgi:aldehyde dehydrogenase (NAD+)
MNTALLEQRFDHIFFTGSPNVGRVVMTAAAKHLTPVTLELGGKSPCIVDRTADIELAAARVVWGKCVNAGQTCVGIDYLLVDEAIKTPFFEALGRQIKLMYSADPISNPEYPKIINQKQFDRLCGLMNGLEPLIGGRLDSEKMKIEPTVFADVTLDDAIMKEEIFGPLLPTFTYQNLDEALDLIRTFEKPLAFYVFSTDKPLIDRIIREMPFGGGCINDALIHLSNPNIPFGGVGESGLGSYHGKRSFDALTHYKSVIKKSAHIEVPLRLPPYRDNLKILRKLLK